MPKREIFINNTFFERKIAVIEDNQLVEYIIEENKHNNLVGNIYKGKVKDVIPGIQSAFIDIGWKKAGYLHVSDIGSFIYEDLEDEDEIDIKRKQSNKIEEILKEGDEIIVQVEKNPVGDKGPKLKTTITIPGRFLVIIPEYNIVGVSRKIKDKEKRKHLKNFIRNYVKGNYGFIVRTSAQYKSEKEIEYEIDYLIKKWEYIKEKASNTTPPSLLYKSEDIFSSVIRDLLNQDVDRCVVDNAEDYREIISYLIENNSQELIPKVKFFDSKDNIFDYFDLNRKIKKIFDKKVWLKNGGYLIIEKTEAMTVIDVNSGSFIGRKEFEETALKVNKQAAEEIARQLRLRNIGGIILVDFIDLKTQEAREELFEYMKELVKKDRTTVKVYPLTELSLMQITRKKISQNMLDYNVSLCPVCNGEGYIPSYLTIFSDLYGQLKTIKGSKFYIELSPFLYEHFVEFNLEELKKILNKEIIVSVNPLFREVEFIVKDNSGKVILHNIDNLLY